MLPRDRAAGARRHHRERVLARELRELLGVDAHVVPGGVDERFRPTPTPSRRGPPWGSTGPYVLTVASRTARKNLSSLDATAGGWATRESTSSPPGATGRSSRRRGGDGGSARPLGHVPDAHLPGLYAGASAFVLPSWHEGFGLTCLEAMACGVPVVAADAGALPETCGDAARYADPGDPDDIATQVLQAIGDARAADHGPAPRGALHLGAHHARAGRPPERRLTPGVSSNARWSSRARPCAR